MAYSKPMCECGSTLGYYKIDLELQFSRINVKGQAGSGLKKTVFLELLKCMNCQKLYRAKYDEKGQLIKGERYYTTFEKLEW